MSTIEREQAWKFLEKEFHLSEDKIIGLHLLNPNKAAQLFLNEITISRDEPKYAKEAQANERCIILMLRFVCKEVPIKENIDLLALYCNSDSIDARTKAAQALPTRPTTLNAIRALRSMIYSETERLPLSIAIVKLMAIYHLEFNQNDSNYKSIYMNLRSPEPKRKEQGVAQLERLAMPELAPSVTNA